MIIERTHVGFRVQVPCKVNLFLEVLGKRNDGYHSLDTVMMAVSLVDELEISRRDDGQLKLSVEFAGETGRPLDDRDPAWSIPADQNNLVIRALDQLRQSLNQTRLGANVRLLKRVPAQAGLGGGSADAAAALVLGLLLWNAPFQPDRLQAVAASLGSDINFFLEGHSNGFWLARCTGRGETIEPQFCTEPLHFVLIHPPRGCGTKEVFQKLSQIPSPNVPRLPTELLHDLRQSNLTALGGALFNRLENAAMHTTEWIDRSRRWIDRYDHLGQCLSGSGSARFCLCTTREQAERIAKETRMAGQMRAWYAPSWQSRGIEEQIREVRNDA